MWEIHLNLFTLDGIINDFDHVEVRGVYRAACIEPAGSESAIEIQKEEEE